jgi:hypothetical protein
MPIQFATFQLATLQLATLQTRSKIPINSKNMEALIFFKATGKRNGVFGAFVENSYEKECYPNSRKIVCQ